MSSRATWMGVLLLAWLASLSGVGCKGCLDLEDYTMVAGQPPGGYGGTGGTGGTAGTGGVGGAVDSCNPGVIEGAVFVAVPAEAGGTGGAGGGNGGAGGVGGSDPCGISSAAAAGLDVFALDPLRGECIARARIEQQSGAQLDGTARIRHTRARYTVVAGTFRGGDLSFPRACTTATLVTLEEPSGATDSLFVARLELDQDDAFCTAWINLASSSDPGATLDVAAADFAGDGQVAIAGALGGALVRFDQSSADSDVQGEAFFARYSSAGALRSVTAFEGSGDGADAAMGLGAHEGGFLVTGTVRYEDPLCHGCTGESQVIDGASACTGASGGGGVGGGGGSGGGAAAGGAGGSLPAPDGRNAFLWNHRVVTDECALLQTMGSDTSGDADAQVGHGVSARMDGGCRAYLAGMAGRSTWRFDAADPNTSLSAAGGVSFDGFLARLDGTSEFDCGDGSNHTWNLRVVPSLPDVVVWGNRIKAQRCSPGAVAALVVDDGDGASLAVHHCAAGTCTPQGDPIALGTVSSRQLVVMGIEGDGAIDWQGVIGPVDLGATSVGGAVLGDSQDNLSLDNRDYVQLVVTTTGPLELQNVELFGCSSVFDQGAAAGTYAIGLTGDGFVGKAQCEWVVPLD